MRDKSGYTKIKTEIYCNMNFNLQKSPSRKKKRFNHFFLLIFLQVQKKWTIFAKLRTLL